MQVFRARPDPTIAATDAEWIYSLADSPHLDIALSDGAEVFLRGKIVGDGLTAALPVVKVILRDSDGGVVASGFTAGTGHFVLAANPARLAEVACAAVITATGEVIVEQSIDEVRLSRTTVISVAGTALQMEDCGYEPITVRLVQLDARRRLEEELLAAVKAGSIEPAVFESYAAALKHSGSLPAAESQRIESHRTWSCRSGRSDPESEPL